MEASDDYTPPLPTYDYPSAEKIERGHPFSGTVYVCTEDEEIDFLGEYNRKRLSDIMREHSIEEGRF